MAATQIRTNEYTVDAATAQLRELNERATEAGKKATNLYLDAFEKTVTGFASLETKLAAASQVDWITDVVGAHANLTRDLGKTCVASARDLIK